MTCTKRTNSCPATSSCCLLHIYETLVYTVNLLHEFGIDYWLDYNSLLGAIEDKVYPTDNIIGIFRQDSQKLLSLSHRIYEDGFFLTSYKDMNGNFSMKIQYSQKNNLAIEIQDWELGRGKVFRKSNVIDRKTMFPIQYIQPLNNISYDSISMKCPNNIEAFLYSRYGR